MLLQHRAVLFGGILTSAIGVVTQSRRRLSRAEGMPQGAQRPIAMKRVVERPPDDRACVPVDKHRQIRPAFVGSHIRDVADPTTV